jgi:hypothetical protein
LGAVGWGGVRHPTRRLDNGARGCDASAMTYFTSLLPNGFVAVTHRSSGLRGLYHRDGTYRSGDLRKVPADVVRGAYRPC